MADNSATITENELLEFKRLAMAYDLDREDFDIREKFIPGTGAVTRVEVFYEPGGVRREYERNQCSSWLGDFGEDLANGRFNGKRLKGPKKTSAQSRTIAAATAKASGRKSSPIGK
jgi:hypothetical protein